MVIQGGLPRPSPRLDSRLRGNDVGECVHDVGGRRERREWEGRRESNAVEWSKVIPVRVYVIPPGVYTVYVIPA